MISLLSILVEGIPLAYSPNKDSWITLLILVCFFISSYVLYRSKRFLLQLAKEFFLHKERNSLFAASTASDMRYLLLLVLQTCLLSALSFFDFLADGYDTVVNYLPAVAWVGIFFVIMLSFILLKWLVYSIIGWIFFDKVKVSMWMESYSTLLYYLGFALFPFTLITIYFDPNRFVYIFVVIGLFSLFKLLTLFKWYKLFCNNFYGSLLLILYFCALEIIPCCILCRGMFELNYLTVKI